MKHIARRELLRGGGAVAIAAAVPIGAMALSAPVSEFAALVRLYFEQVDEFNATSFNANGEPRTDEESDWVAAAGYEATLHRMLKTPIRTPQDATAALDWMEREGIIETWCGDCSGLIEGMTSSLRSYLAAVRS